MGLVVLQEGDTVTEHKFLCPHNEAEQYPNIGVWRREGFIARHARRQIVHALKTLNLSINFSKALL